ncbi:hypothetical protein [Fulvivirga sediminis]|uniref:Thioredoxin domain-containing protein n=1 Tax=Fulvivirga sediminis TaxID=2803949 RepID=A0A937JWH2_9BACT|nr:hypothetical protein [Fulvivirga sediminis]MBL3654548.1 hypothetical protein [Fulvivirga sediminis]
MNFKRVLLAVLFLAFIKTVASAQVVGKKFPELEAETVSDSVVILPKGTMGKYTLVGMAYSKKSEKDLNTWFSPVYNKFLREGGGLFSSFGYDVNVYFIPMFTGINAAATGTAKNKATKNIDPKLLPNILFYKGKLKPYKESLAFDKKDVPYFFVLDKQGKIVYATSGSFSDKKMSEIEDVLE